ncbi:MAG: response regulator [bacterium]
MARVLIVDDEKDVVTLVRFLMEKEGYEVMEAYNGEEALSRIGVDPLDPNAPLPDVIIMDIMMPVMDGYTLQARLRESERSRKIPVVILTAKGQMKDLFQLASNISAFLEKPFEPKFLLEMVKKALNGK